MFCSPEFIGMGEEEAMVAMILACNVCVEAKCSEICNLGLVCDLERARFGEEIVLGRGAHGPKVVKGEGEEGDMLVVKYVDD